MARNCRPLDVLGPSDAAIALFALRPRQQAFAFVAAHGVLFRQTLRSWRLGGKRSDMRVATQ
ncbi:MAG: hypothetical protein Q8R98_07780 [Rubrivivax sp.]|nr:hypothetical protein [Rubrivivax sp.]MDP3611735.1 hypothetical protein [Rubrivivax sp.]